MGGTDGKGLGKAVLAGLCIYVHIRTGLHINGVFGLDLDGIIGHIEGNGPIITNRSGSVRAIAKNKAIAERNALLLAIGHLDAQVVTLTL